MSAADALKLIEREIAALLEKSAPNTASHAAFSMALAIVRNAIQGTEKEI